MTSEAAKAPTADAAERKPSALAEAWKTWLTKTGNSTENWKPKKLVNIVTA